MGIYKDFFTDIIKEQYLQIPSFLDGIEDMSAFVENNTINLAEAGIDPRVLIDSEIVYPVPIATRTDLPMALPLSTAITENTVIRSIEEIQTAYDKTASVLRGHTRSLINSMGKNASYNFTPSSDTTYTPVITTSGADNGNGFKMLVEEDILRLAERFDRIDAPDGVRTLALNDRHLSELLRTSQTLKFQQQFLGKEGVIGNQVYELYGFKIEKYKTAGVFNKGTGVKKAFNAVAAPLTDTISSVAFVRTEVGKGMGSLDMFFRLNDPEQRGDIYGFQQRFFALPLRNKFIAAIYSAAV